MGGYTRYTYDYYQNLKIQIEQCKRDINYYRTQKKNAFDQENREIWSNYNSLRDQITSEVKAICGNNK